MSNVKSLIDEVESAFRNGTTESRCATLQRITDLFIGGADGYNQPKIAVFDGVLCGLVDKIERKTLAKLSGRIGPLKKAPPRLCGQLSRHDDIEAARPVLQHSPVLSEGHLSEIAESKSQLRLEAIANRSQISARVSDALINRGNGAVLTAAARNLGAGLSTRGYTATYGPAVKNRPQDALQQGSGSCDSSRCASVRP